MREKLSRLGRRLLQLEKETRYPAHPPSSPAEAYVADVGAWKCVVVWDGSCLKSSLYAPYWLEWSQSFKQNVVQSTENLHHTDYWSIDVTLCIWMAFGGNVGVL